MKLENCSQASREDFEKLLVHVEAALSASALLESTMKRQSIWVIDKLEQMGSSADVGKKTRECFEQMKLELQSILSALGTRAA